MTRTLRYRILALQAGLVVILGFCAGFAFWASSYVQSQVSTQLTAQGIVFPAANSPEITALPKADAAAMRQYAGQTLTTGPQAEVWANDFMRIHLLAMPTYDQAATIARAHPTNAADQATWNTVFMGTTDRAMLLNAYGWWTVGTYTSFAAIGLAVAAFAVLVALGFELWRFSVAAREEKSAPASLPVPAPAHGYGTTAPGYGVAQFTRHDS